MTPTPYGRYTLLKKLAVGGMAEVFLARQKGSEQSSRLLVVKRILPHLAGDEEFVMMFLNEARIAARFNHPNIVQIYDLGREEDSYFLAMEYIHGEDLGRIMRTAWSARSWVPVPIALRVIASACAGLHYAHTKTDERGVPLRVVHRDISPQNILVGFDGNAKIVDFGIARAADQASTTRAGAIKGKFAYMSPEQAGGKPIDHRSDLFAAGLILYELLTGMRPLKRESDMLTLRAAVECQIPPPSQVANVPASVDPLVMTALARSVDERFQTAREFQEAIDQLLIANGWNTPVASVAGYLRELFAERLDEESRSGRIFIVGSESSSSIPVVAEPARPSEPARATRAELAATAGPVAAPAARGAPSREAVLAEATSLVPTLPEEGEDDEDAGEEHTEALASVLPGGAADRVRAALRLVRGGTQGDAASGGRGGDRARSRRTPGGARPSVPGGRRRRSVLHMSEEEVQLEQRRRQELVRGERGVDDEPSSTGDLTGERSRGTESVSSALPPRPRRRWGLLVALGLAAGAATVLFVPGMRDRAERALRAVSARPLDRGRGLGDLDPARAASLTLESNVALDVYLGTNKLGTTPLDGIAVPAGRVALRFENPGFGIEKTVELHVDAGTQVRHREDFSLGRVQFRSNQDCDVYLRGRKVARAPGPPLEYFEGSYDFECRNEPLGLAGRSRVSIPADAQRVVVVSFALEPI